MEALLHLVSSTLTLDAGTGTIALYSATAADASGGKITIADADLLQLTGGDVIIDGEIDNDDGEFLKIWTGDDGLTQGDTIQVTGNTVTLGTRNDAIDLTGYNIIGDTNDRSLSIESNNAVVTLAAVGAGGADNDIGTLVIDGGDGSSALDLNGDITSAGTITLRNFSGINIDASATRTITSGGDLSSSGVAIQLDGGRPVGNLDQWNK